MLSYVRTFTVCLAIALPVVIALCPLSASETVIQWRFDRDGDMMGWTAGGHVRDARVADGALRGETTDWDPIVLGPVFEIEASATQRVEIDMKTPQGGRAELFWTETLKGQYGGFSQQKAISFATEPSDSFRTYRIDPFWHAAGKIVRLRLDPPATGEFAIRSIRIVEIPSTTSQANAWRFTDDLNGWRAWRDVSDLHVSDRALTVASQGKSPTLMSPLLDIDAATKPYVSLRMAVDRGRSGRIVCVSSSQFGAGEITFPLRADGQWHTYNVDVRSLSHWRDRIMLLGVQPTDTSGGTVRIASIEVADAPRGPADLQITYFGPREGVNRAGKPCYVTLVVKNLGGEAAQDVRAELAAGSDLQITNGPKQVIDQILPWLTKRLEWEVKTTAPHDADLTVKLAAENVPPLTATSRLRFTPIPPVEHTAYIPEPQPMVSPYEIGAFYFPGWPTVDRWKPILDYPERKPVLGWYDEGDPECADWQIKWAVEHGVTFFLVDWYWCQGRRQLEHWLHDAYGQSRFRKHLKWAVMWANHNPPNTHSDEDWRAVTRYWIENYFGTDEYYRIDGRPAVFIWSPSGIRRDLGGSDQAARLYEMSQQMARDAGLPGIYFAAMSSHETEAACRQLKSEGYEGFTSYHSFQLAAGRAGSRQFPFADVVDTSPEVWRSADDRSSGLDYFPIVDTGWDSRPWHGQKALTITDRTPDQFGRLCRSARRYADENDKRIVLLGPWNEWGEGSYIEPCAERGFEDLDQLRAAFCPPGNWPPNLIPADIGRGPYDLPVSQSAGEN